MHDEDEIGQACHQIHQLVSSDSTPLAGQTAERLIQLLAQSDCTAPQSVLDLIASLFPQLDKPWDYFSAMLQAENLELASQGVTLSLEQIAKDQLGWDQNALVIFGKLTLREDGPFDDEDLLLSLGDNINRHYRPKGCAKNKGLAHLFLKNPDPGLQGLAARLLDQRGQLPDAALSRQFIGEKAWHILGPYLTYTRANHCDLAAMNGGGEISDRVLEEFQLAGEKFGGVIVRQVVATLGWQCLNQGLQIEEFTPLEWPGTAPLFIHPQEVGLFATTPAPQQGQRCHLVMARGGLKMAVGNKTANHDQVDQFRRINVAHAELLNEFLETAPACRRKIEKIIQLMDEIVAAFYQLFSGLADEYMILPDVWKRLRKEAEEKLAAHKSDRDLPADLVRLVMAFEDPANLGEVRTIHGLKRRLHQHGLKLGFNLVDSGQTPNRTVSLLLLPEQGDPVEGPTLRYAELETSPEAEPNPWLPHPVRLAVDGLVWQLLHGTKAFPGVEVFVFGNEVHYYFTFRNHPAFLRVDFSPPQRGGMLDLEYYGVSNYETDIHPNLELNAICSFYRAMDLEARVEGTRLFVRYDKERSHSLGDLQEKVASLLRFSPFLMDIDWVAGSLQLSSGLRQLVVDAWARRFSRSGIFPVSEILTESRRQILIERKIGPGGEAEVTWSGKGPYQDCWHGETPADLWETFAQKAQSLGLPTPTAEARTLSGPMPLLAIHQHIIGPVRRRIQSGQILAQDGILEKANANLCQQEHETTFFARLLASPKVTAKRLLAEAVGMASTISFAEKFMNLQITGFVGSLRIERGRLELRGGVLRIYAGRDEHGVIRMGVATFEDRLLRRRTSSRSSWQSNAWTDSDRLLALLRSANYVCGDINVGDVDVKGTLKELRHQAELPGPGPASVLLTEPNLLEGTAAAPGRATGRAIFGTTGHRPEDMLGSLLIAREIRPSDSQFLMMAGGIISTGGAVLSHAALLATQFGKPALVVDAEWDDSGPVSQLFFDVTLYRTDEHELHGLHVCRRSVTAHTSGQLREGDLCILDAGHRIIRVLGQDPDTLILWQGFQLLSRAQAAGDLTGEPQKILDIRAQKLRARHQIKKALHRISNGTVADFAVEEIVLGEGLACLPEKVRAEFLDELLANPSVQGRVQPQLEKLSRNLSDYLAEAKNRYLNLTPSSTCQYQILGWRLRCLRLQESLQLLQNLQARCQMKVLPPAAEIPLISDDVAWQRLKKLERKMKDQIKTDGPHLRHSLRRLERLQSVLPGSADRGGKVAARTADLIQKDKKSVSRLTKKLILHPRQCGLETFPLIGWKGANLAEIDRLSGPETTPLWFALSNTSLETMLAQPLTKSALAKRHLGHSKASLGQAISETLKLDRADCEAKARIIRQFWDEVDIPEKLVSEVAEAHRKLTSKAGKAPFVALRSSSRDEDSEISMQAGIYDTFLFVQGMDAVMETLRKTWAGFWTERALYSREKAGDLDHHPSAGIVVQRMIEARVSGVLQTVNVAAGNLNEMVINVGLGLGEGIVSGLVAADLITVVKDQRSIQDQLHFNYLTNDKPQQMVFDKRRGRGTRLQDTLYHQRLRPAIEYSEICDIARAALTLESIYGYPLDIEFAIEGDRLWILQARPISVILAEHQITADLYPLKKPTSKRQVTGD